MNLQLVGKRALVTGASAGIGVAIAKVLAREGARVLVHGRDVARVNAVVDLIVSTGGQAIPITGDLATDNGAASVYSKAKLAFGGIDILINNAGAYEARPWFETTPATWRMFFETDVLSAVRLILAIVPDLRQAGWGRIINVATGMATTPQVVMADYAAAKAAMVNSTVSLAKALAGTGVTANTISPGVIHTEGVERVLREAAKRLGWGDDWEIIQRRWFEDVLSDKTVKRLGRVEEVADLVAFVASPLAGYINGANLRVDGGKSPSVN
jgi:NAD(P)-dependent dehydrogenase (short-subunit alcohol dehydrogenase family)